MACPGQRRARVAARHLAARPHAALVTVGLGEYIDASVIAAVLALNAVIGFTQERRAEASVRALMRLLSPKARVIREGKEWEVDSRVLVPGDLVLFESGVRVPADVRLVSTAALAVDESLLTGESVTVAKQARPLAGELPLADRANMAYTGTIVTSGRARGYVVTTGARTELGAIAGQLREEEKAATPLQQRMARFSHVVGGAVAVAAVLGFAVGVTLGYSPAEMFMLAVALSVAAIPEGLPVVLTITLAVGVGRMARRRAIIRRLPAVETLGSTSVIGSDKTGTLTENRMTVEELWAGGRSFPVRGEMDRLEPLPEAASLLAEHHPLFLTLLTGVLTNEAEVYVTERGVESRGDPTEVALLVAAARMGIEHEEARSAHPVFAEIPFEPDRQYSASVRLRDGRYEVFVKGAPERVLAMCASLVSKDGEREISPGEVGAPVLTGVELAEMDDEALRQRVKELSLFARVSPDQKLRVVRALQARGEVVAVTGDGVNDAPALKAADIGVAMGQSGTDVARETADMVLADDNFVSIYAAVEEGRVTFDNLRKATFFLVSTGVATVITILAAMLLGWPLPFVPAQLLWLNLVTNCLQDVALAFEPGERDVLERPPRKKAEGIISALLWERTAIAGLVMAAGTLALFRWELDRTGSVSQARTVALTTMVFFQMFQVGNSRSESLSVFAKSPLSNRFLFAATVAALAVHVAALHLAPTQLVLRVEPVADLAAWGRIAGVAATIVVAMELHKWARRRPGGYPWGARRPRTY